MHVYIIKKCIWVDQICLMLIQGYICVIFLCFKYNYEENRQTGDCNILIFYLFYCKFPIFFLTTRAAFVRLTIAAWQHGSNRT